MAEAVAVGEYWGEVDDGGVAGCGVDGEAELTAWCDSLAALAGAGVDAAGGCAVGGGGGVGVGVDGAEVVGDPVGGGVGGPTKSPESTAGDPLIVAYSTR